MDNTLTNLRGEAWLKELLRFVAKGTSKKTLVDALGTYANSPEALSPILRPYNPHISSIELSTEGERVVSIGFTLNPDFGLSIEQLVQAYPDCELVKNTYDYVNELMCRNVGDGVLCMSAGAEFGKDLTKPLGSIGFSFTSTQNDSRFGRLAFNPEHSYWEAARQWGKTLVRLYIVADEGADLRSWLSNAQALWQNQIDWELRVRRTAAEKLLRRKNENWLQDHEVAVTEQEFCQRLTLKSIIMHGDGEFKFYFEDGDLFYGHTITVSGTLRTGPIDAGIDD